MIRQAALVALALTACTDALLQPQASTGSTLDDRLALRGKVCARAPNPSAFPVKVIFLIDSSGSMCVSDGPGSQATGGFCELIGDALRARGITTPGRVRALHDVVDRFVHQGNVQVALIPFDSKVANAYPSSAVRFVPANDGELGSHIDALQNELGKGTDYQGALAEAYYRIESDIQASIAGGHRATLPRTKYVVILLTDGTPYPRCTSNVSAPGDPGYDPSIWANENNPAGIWPDNPATFCKPVDPSCCKSASYDCQDPNAGDDGRNTVIPDYVICTDRNQNYQIFDAADRLAALKEKYNVGEVRLHTILLFNLEGVREAVAIGGQAVLTDLFNGMPTPEAAEAVARWTLTELAVQHGNGTFQEFLSTASIELGSLDYTSLASKFVQKTLLAFNTAALPALSGPEVDSDGDGAADAIDAAQVEGTSRLDVDSDGDGFPDRFEIGHRGEGFDPMAIDPRGCKDGPGIKAKYSCRDTDGDGLSQALEAYLETDSILPDTDTDGMPDGLEVMLGLSPLVPNGPLIDHDLDGVPDVAEVFQHTHPLLDDRLVHARDGYRYEVKLATPEEGDRRTCYDFVVSNIRLLTPDRATGQHGFNYLTVTFGEAPEAGVSRDYATWKQACAFAQFAPPSLRMPEGPEIILEPDDFRALESIPRPAGSIVPTDYQTRCKGAVP